MVESTALEMRHTGNRIGGSNPSLSASLLWSVPDTWVTVYSGDMGNTLVVSLSLMVTHEAARSLRRYWGALRERLRECRSCIGAEA